MISVAELTLLVVTALNFVLAYRCEAALDRAENALRAVIKVAEKLMELEVADAEAEEDEE